MRLVVAVGIISGVLACNEYVPTREPTATPLSSNGAGVGGAAGGVAAGGVAGSAGAGGYASLPSGGAGVGAGGCTEFTSDPLAVSRDCALCLCSTYEHGASFEGPSLDCGPRCWALLRCESESGCAADQTECSAAACGDPALADVITAADRVRPYMPACVEKCPELARD